MTDEEFLDKWLEYEMYIFILNYVFVYGEDYVSKNGVWLRREFIKKWERMTEEEKEKRCQSFIQILKQVKGGTE